MFNDSHEVSRNVGIMGVLLALLVLGGLYGLGASFLTGMEFFKKDEVSTKVLIEKGRNQIEALKADLEGGKKLQVRVADHQALLEKIESATSELEAEEKVVFEAEEKVSQARLELQKEMAALKGYQRQYRQLVRTRAEGETIDLSGLKGDSFREARIMGISPIRLRVMTKTGVVGIDYQELPEKLQQRFQFNKEEAEAYREYLKVQGERRDQQIAKFREKQKVAQAEAALERRKEMVKQAENDLVRLKKQAQILQKKVKEFSSQAEAYTNEAKSARAAGRVTSKFGLASQAQRKADSYRRRADSAQAQITRKMQELTKLREEIASEGNE